MLYKGLIFKFMGCAAILALASSCCMQNECFFFGGGGGGGGCAVICIGARGRSSQKGCIWRNRCYAT